MSFIREKATRIGILLPPASIPVASYVPVRRAQSTLWISGQLPLTKDGLLMTGVLGESVSLEDGGLCARQCAMNLLAHLDAWLDTHPQEEIACVAKLEGFVACVPAFTTHHVVMNSASDLIVDVLGELGKHARAAVGVPSLPLGAPVEISGVVLLAG